MGKHLITFYGKYGEKGWTMDYICLSKCWNLNMHKYQTILSNICLTQVSLSSKQLCLTKLNRLLTLKYLFTFPENIALFSRRLICMILFVFAFRFQNQKSCQEYNLVRIEDFSYKKDDHIVYYIRSLLTTKL